MLPKIILKSCYYYCSKDNWKFKLKLGFDRLQDFKIDQPYILITTHAQNKNVFQLLQMDKFTF